MKQFKLIVIVIFWLVLYLITRSQKIHAFESPYIRGLVFIVFVGHLWYEGIYKKNKIENKKAEITKKHLSELKRNQKRFNLQISKEVIPDELIEFIPVFQKWGIENKILRADLNETASNIELYKLKSIEDKRELIENWIENDRENPEISKAMILTLKSYDDLGLWTWKTKK